jgi:DNA primase
LFEFAIRSALSKHNLDTTEGQLAALDEAAPIVARIKDAGLRQRYAVNLDRWLGLMNERFVLQRVRQHGGSTRGARAGAGGAGRYERGNGAAQGGQPRVAASQGEGEAAPERYDLLDPALRVEREALKLAVQVPMLCDQAFDALGSHAFSVPQHERLASLITRCGGVASAGRPRDWAARLIEAAPDDRARGFLRELALEQLQVAGEPDQAYGDVILARVEELAVSRQIAAAKARLQRMDPAAEQAEYVQLFGDLMALEQRRQILLRRATGG